MIPDFYTVPANWARDLGVEKAIILQRIKEWTRLFSNNRSNEFEGFYWFYHSNEAWLEELCFISKRSLQRYLAELKSEGWIVSRQENSTDRRNYYRFNDDKLKEYEGETLANGHDAKSGTCKPPNWHLAQTKENIAPDTQDVQVNKDSANLAAWNAPNWRHRPTLREEPKERSKEDITARVLPETAPVEVLPAIAHERIKKVLEPKKAKAPSTEGSEVWEAYSQAFVRRYGKEPRREASKNAICANLVKKLGKEDAKAFVSYYLSHSDQRYVKSGHDLKNAIYDCHKLDTEMKVGMRFTTHTATVLERQQHNEQVVRMVRADIEANGYGIDPFEALIEEERACKRLPGSTKP